MDKNNLGLSFLLSVSIKRIPAFRLEKSQQNQSKPSFFLGSYKGEQAVSCVTDPVLADTIPTKEGADHLASLGHCYTPREGVFPKG